MPVLDKSKPWSGLPNIKSVRSAHEGIRSPLSKGHTAPLPKGGGNPQPPKK